MALSKIDVANMLTGLVPNDNTIRRPNAKPLIFNGDMKIAQRGTSTSSVTSTGYYACDRWNTTITSGGTWTVSQDTDVPTGQGFLTSMKYDCTSANTSLSANSILVHNQANEGQNLQVLKKGTANAEKITLAFWVKATKTGTNIVELFDNTNTRQVSKSYTISSSNTWEKKVLNFPADTSGAFANDNSGALSLLFYLTVGTNQSSGTLSETWTAYSNPNRAAGQVNHADSTSNNWYITGVQMEVGEYTSDTLPPFQHETFGDNLLRCQRYCQQWNHDMTGGNETQVGIGWAYNSSSIYGFKDLVIPMRTQPTMSSVSGTNYYRTHNNNTAQSFNQIGFNASSTKGFWIFNAGTFSSLATDEIRTVEIANANGYVRADAEF